MKLTVFVDNNTLIYRYFLAEPGFSLFIEDEGVSLLFDVGYSNIFCQMPQKWGLIYAVLMRSSFLTVIGITLGGWCR